MRQNIYQWEVFALTVTILASTLLGLKKLSFKSRWELGVVEQSRYHHLTYSTFVQMERRSHIKGVISIVHNGPLHHCPGKGPDECRQIPIAGQYRRGVERRR